MTRIGVVGLGLMGGSLALAAARAGHRVVAWDIEGLTRQHALEAGITVSADLSAAELIAFALPLPALTDDLTSTLAGVRISETATITDVGSVKQPVAEAISTAGLSQRYVGGHPMAGTEQTGFLAATADLLTGARWVLCPPEQGELDRWLQVAAMVTSLGAEVLALSAAEHDAAMGLISGLPHLLALGLESAVRSAVAQGADYLPTLASGSFADITRVAGSAPHLLHAVTESNKDSVQTALHQLLERLDGSWDALVDAGHRAHHVRQQRSAGAIGRSPDAGQPDTVAVQDVDELLALGRSGRYVLSVDTDRRMMTVSPAAKS